MKDSLDRIGFASMRKSGEDIRIEIVYEYSKSGQIVARTANGVRQTYEYDKKGQLLAVKDPDGNAVERYCYDKAGNMLGTTVGSKQGGKYSAAALTAFGEDLSVTSSGESFRSPFPVPHSPFLHRQALRRRSRPRLPHAQLPRGPLSTYISGVIHHWKVVLKKEVE